MAMSQQPDTPHELLDSLDRTPVESAYDQELAQFAGEDARKVWKGELTREEFFELYDEQFREEFGDDYVPPEGFTDD